MSLVQERNSAPHNPAGMPRAGVGEAREWRSLWAGALIVSVGLLLMVPAAAEALSASVSGSERGDVLRGSNLDERVVGLGGADELYSGGGTDHLSSGEGDDFVEASDGERDIVACGPGADVASVDLVDLVAPDCERVYPG